MGPLKESFIIYNSQGKSKGMAIVSFQRSGDAVVARAKYNGKIVDGSEYRHGLPENDSYYSAQSSPLGRPIKIEIIADGTSPSQAPVPTPTPTLLNRLGGIKPASINSQARPAPAQIAVAPPV